MEEVEEEEDSHCCGKCHKVFLTLEDYLQHKMQEHKVKVKYTKSLPDRRILVPRLVEPVRIKREPNDNNENVKPVRKSMCFF